MNDRYFYQFKVGDRVFRGLSIAGLNVLRRALELLEVRPADWLAMSSDERRMIRHDTFTRATPELAERLFGEKIDLEAV